MPFKSQAQRRKFAELLVAGRISVTAFIRLLGAKPVTTDMVFWDRERNHR